MWSAKRKADREKRGIECMNLQQINGSRRWICRMVYECSNLTM